MACKSELKPENHKLLACLHSVCLECVDEIKRKAELATKDPDDEVNRFFCLFFFYSISLKTIELAN